MLTIYSDRREYWLQFFLLLITTCIAQLSNIAYQKVSNGEPFANTLLPSLLFLSLITVPSLFVGLSLGKKLGLGLINNRISEPGAFGKGIKFALFNAIILGCILLAVRWGLSSSLPEEVPEYGFRGPIGGILVSFGAGIGEEVWFRFGLMTFLLYLIKYALRHSTLTDGISLSVIAVVGVAFGMAHLPQLWSYGVSDMFPMVSTVAGNTVVSMLYGWCFWRYGLISAIVAHFSLDIVLHFLPALFL